MYCCFPQCVWPVFDSRNVFGLFFFCLNRLGFAFSRTYPARFFSSICSSVIRLFLTDNNIQAYCVPTLKTTQKPTQQFVFIELLKTNKFGIIIRKCQFVITRLIFLPFFVIYQPLLANALPFFVINSYPFQTGILGVIPVFPL